MPYGSDEYVGSDWTEEELAAHFKEIGFTHIEEEFEPDDYYYGKNLSLKWKIFGKSYFRKYRKQSYKNTRQSKVLM